MSTEFRDEKEREENPIEGLIESQVPPDLEDIVDEEMKVNYRPAEFQGSQDDYVIEFDTQETIESDDPVSVAQDLLTESRHKDEVVKGLISLYKEEVRRINENNDRTIYDCMEDSTRRLFDDELVRIYSMDSDIEKTMNYLVWLEKNTEKQIDRLEESGRIERLSYALTKDNGIADYSIIFTALFTAFSAAVYIGSYLTGGEAHKYGEAVFVAPAIMGAISTLLNVPFRHIAKNHREKVEDVKEKVGEDYFWNYSQNNWNYGELKEKYAKGLIIGDYGPMTKDETEYTDLRARSEMMLENFIQNSQKYQTGIEA